MKSDIKILITIPYLSKIGGVANYYNVLKKYFTCNVDYFQVGSGKEKINIINLVLNRIKHTYKFYKKIKTNNYNLVVFNPSLDIKSIVRDGSMAFIAWTQNVNFITFFRGWDKNYENSISSITLFIIKHTFLKSKAIVVLAKDFEKTFRDWGYKNKIYRETTVFDDNLTKNVSEVSIFNKYSDIIGIFKILFISRVEKGKGIFELVKAFKILQELGINTELLLAGEGSDLLNLKKYVLENNINNVKILGNVINTDKENLFLESHVYILPSYAEGMPNSLLEAFGFGLPAITTDVGGIKDFFINNDMGYILENIDPETIAEKISLLLKNTENMKMVAVNNYKYAFKHFSASTVVKRIENIYLENIY